MAWITITFDDVKQQGFSAAETATALSSTGIADAGAKLVATAIAEFQSSVKAAGGAVGASGTVPASVVPRIIDIVRWRLLITFPALKAYQTKERQSAFTEAISYVERVARHEVPVEPPIDPGADSYERSGNWNSERKVVGRMHPIPLPGLQFQAVPPDTGYANAAVAGDASTLPAAGTGGVTELASLADLRAYAVPTLPTVIYLTSRADNDGMTAFWVWANPKPVGAVDTGVDTSTPYVTPT